MPQEDSTNKTQIASSHRKLYTKMNKYNLHDNIEHEH